MKQPSVVSSSRLRPILARRRAIWCAREGERAVRRFAGDFETWCIAWGQAKLGGPIVVRTFEGAISTTEGAVVRTGREATVLVPAEASGVAREVVVAHEVAHLVLGHVECGIPWQERDAELVAARWLSASLSGGVSELMKKLEERGAARTAALIGLVLS